MKKSCSVCVCVCVCVHACVRACVRACVCARARVRLEPTTYCLLGRCSTTELNGWVKSKLYTYTMEISLTQPVKQVDSKGWFTIRRKACVTYVALHTSYSEPFRVNNCVNYVACVACARIDKSSILAYVCKET